MNTKINLCNRSCDCTALSIDAESRCRHFKRREFMIPVGGCICRTESGVCISLEARAEARQIKL